MNSNFGGSGRFDNTNAPMQVENPGNSSTTYICGCKYFN